MLLHIGKLPLNALLRDATHHMIAFTIIVAFEEQFLTTCLFCSISSQKVENAALTLELLSPSGDTNVKPLPVKVRVAGAGL